MARNQVQFQKGLSEARFAEIYGTEEQCHAALVKWRWPNGFECPGCNGADHCIVTRGARFFLIAALVRKFGAPIQTFIEKHLMWVTLGVLAAIVAGFWLVLRG